MLALGFGLVFSLGFCFPFLLLLGGFSSWVERFGDGFEDEDEDIVAF